MVWSKVARPRELGGLGVLDLTTLGYALQLRWAWYSRTDQSRSWIGLPTKEEKIVQAMFKISTTVQVGNGARTLFWQDKWIDGNSVEDIAPLVWAAVPKRLRNSRLVNQALADNQWARHIAGSLSVLAIRQFLQLWDRMQILNLDPNSEDKFIWRWSSNQQYSASSAYRAFFTGQCSIPGAKELSKTRATPRCRFFFWLVLLGRCWTSVRLQRHNLPNHGNCALCAQEAETIDHLTITCVYTREVWFPALRRPRLQHLAPTVNNRSLVDWWLHTRKRSSRTTERVSTR